jgi:hypothetical protein
MRAREWTIRIRALALTLGTLAAMLVAGAANWPRH